MNVLALVFAAAAVTSTAGTAVLADDPKEIRIMKSPGRLSDEELEALIPLGMTMAEVAERLGFREEESDQVLADGRVQWFWQPLGGEKNVRVLFRDGKVVSRETRFHGIHWE